MDFNGIIAASKKEQIRAWSIERACNFGNAPYTVDDMLKEARKIEDAIYADDREKAYLAAEEKVTEILRSTGYPPDDIPHVLKTFRDAHIRFLEVKQ